MIRIRGLDAHRVRKQVEVNRRNHGPAEQAISDIESAVTFEQATEILEGIAQGTEALVEVSVVLLSDQPLVLDPELFVRECLLRLTIDSACGARPRFFRSLICRAVTACDLVPLFGAPRASHRAPLQDRNGKPVDFHPLDPRLEALHWLVVGASGSGKSFFAGLVLLRLLKGPDPISILFVDHNRSFRRLVRNLNHPYAEPTDRASLHEALEMLPRVWAYPRSVSGIELSDLPLHEKKRALGAVMARVEAFLRTRDTTHPFYLVLDECWSFLRDEPLLVQRAFREFRKFNGAVVAITQSLQDFLTDESGRSIFQNAPVRILLRQGEDLTPYRGMLGLNPTELELVHRLYQKRGEYAECLVKTPYLSRLARLVPRGEEHEWLRTDNLREERIREAKVGLPFQIGPLVKKAGLALALFLVSPAQAFMGTELPALLQLVSGQVTEIQRLTEFVGIGEANIALIKQLNEGIQQTVAQIYSIETLMQRSQGLDPSEIRSLRDLNDVLSRAQGVQRTLEEVWIVRLALADQAISKTALQSETSYQMGQEMLVTGSQLAQESRTASPGRAAQISAAAGSAQMLSQGVELQLLSQLAQLQALQLEFQKEHMRAEVEQSRARRREFEQSLKAPRPRRRS
mgnify:CR=1 FL=1